jgi:hypothetical protein
MKNSAQKRYVLISKFLFYSFLISFYSCDKVKNEEIDFNQWRKNQNKDFSIKLDDKKNIFFFDGIPSDENYLTGKPLFSKNVVYFKSENYKNLKFTLFDFNLLKNECREIKYTKAKEKKYNLCNQDIFYDKERNDTIYKFCFKYYNMFTPKTSLVFFVSKKNGILGEYLVEYSESDSLSISERMVGEVYSERYHYENFPHFSIK